MLDTPGPYLLDVIVPHQEHVLPMIPSGGAFKDVITEGDGRSEWVMVLMACNKEMRLRRDGYTNFNGVKDCKSLMQLLKGDDID
ncbi:hypothetical protein ACH5RR_037178 [Cinchona calisaya]|uniref:Uncharacterized protein n=1 Tax=Cinchona calisaya TaxID=153742 RepID=A0ABD2Y9R5_9GENT